MSSISEKVLEKIKKEQVKPKPKWWFELEQWAVIVLIVFSLSVGALSVGLILELTFQLEIMGVWNKIQEFKVIIFSLPYIWIVLFTLLAILVIAEMMRTRYGYRYRLRNLALGSLLVIVIGGIIFYVTGLASYVEKKLERNFSFYPQITRTPQSFWSQPEYGLISGNILQRDENQKSLEIKDWENGIWKVDYSQAYVRPRVDLIVGEPIKVLGEKDGEKKFKAEEIRPWGGCPMCQKHMNKGKETCGE